MFTFLYKKLVRAFMAAMLCATSLFLPAEDLSGVTAAPVTENADIRAVSFNLRCTGAGRTSIPYRAPLMAAQLNVLHADSMGFQEANYRWISYLEDHLTDYAYAGVGRTNGKTLGEYSPVFYLKDKYDLIDSGTFWLSKTPGKPGSKDWGSQNIRVCTWVLLENKETGSRYVHLNTHLDHISAEARENQMKVLLTKVREFLGVYPVVLTGDFNDNDQSAMYALAAAELSDAAKTAKEADDKATYHNYGKLPEPKKIDFVFLSPDVTPLVYHVIDDKINGEYLSDHFGIYVDIQF